MTRKRGRLLHASAVLGAAGAGVALTAGPAAADVGASMATPTTHLHDGQSVSVSWDTGQPWTSAQNEPGAAAECYEPIPPGALGTVDLLSCDPFGSQLQAVKAPDGDLAYQGTINVKKSFIAADGHAVACTNQCSIIVVQGESPAFLSSGSVPITFK